MSGQPPTKEWTTLDMMLIGGYVKFAPGMIAPPLEHLVGPSQGALGECGLPLAAFDRPNIFLSFFIL